MRCKGQSFVIETNSNPGLTGVTQITGVNVAQKIVEFMEWRYKVSRWEQQRRDIEKEVCDAIQDLMDGWDGMPAVFVTPNTNILDLNGGGDWNDVFREHLEHEFDVYIRKQEIAHFSFVGEFAQLVQKKIYIS